MPELSKHGRGSGARVVDGVQLRRRRVYTTDDVDRPCEACGFPLVRQLVEAEPDIRTHPSCDPPA